MRPSACGADAVPLRHSHLPFSYMRGWCERLHTSVYPAVCLHVINGVDELRPGSNPEGLAFLVPNLCVTGSSFPQK